MPKKRNLPDPNKSKGKGKKLRPFHQFSLLPAELRKRVWELVDPEPRVVEIRRHMIKTKKHGESEQIRCLSRAPSILHVCRESRRIAIKRNLYQRAFVRGPTFTWVNFEADMISVSPLDTSWLEAEIPLIQRFRFESTNGESFFHFRSKQLLALTKLKELHIICQDSAAYWVNVAEEMGFPTEKVFFISPGPSGTTTYSRQQLLEKYPARPFAEYSNSYYRQLYDKRIKGTEGDVPDELYFGVSSAES